jgi:glucose-6-phosphate isomerase
MTAIAAMERLEREDAIGQLRQREGTMARLGSEGVTLKLDWVEMIPWLLSHPEALATVESEAAELLTRGTHHIIWAGMGGSVLSVRVMRELGFNTAPCEIHPLDSTDPAALNTLLEAIEGDFAHTVMIGVALGMTSEEPISHLEWFAGVLAEESLDIAEHQLVMALPGSYLERYARDHHLRQAPLQLDGGSGTGGRMSAPGTRVFLLPAALHLAAEGAKPGALGVMLQRAWSAYNLDGAQATPRAHQMVVLATLLAGAARNGVVRLSMATPLGWESLRDWTEQLMEESLGKDGKGVMVFVPYAIPPHFTPETLRLLITSQADTREHADWFIVEPLIASDDSLDRMAGLAAIYLGLQLTMALYGYLWNIPFAGQPAVESYKALARKLRDSAAIELARPLYLDARQRQEGLAMLPSPPDLEIKNLQPSLARPAVYLDVTINGAIDPTASDALDTLEESLWRLAVTRLGIPYKLRRAPAAYHSTEQCEMDGPAGVISIRALALDHAPIARGRYTPRFLEAQAVATWQAMRAQRRECYLALYDGTTEGMLWALTTYFDQFAQPGVIAPDDSKE